MTAERLLRLAFAAAAIGWAVALPVAAAFAAAPHAPAGEYLAAALAYSVGGVICHQQAGRSFHLFGVQLPVCARCTGIYIGAALAAALFVARFARVGSRRNLARIAPRSILLAACVPVALTLAFEWTTGITPSNVVRALSGAPLGAAIAWLIVGPLAGNAID